MTRITALTLFLVLLAPVARAELGKRTVEQKKLYENVYTVCIGVNGQLHDDLIPPLQFAGNDAQSVYDLFTERYGYDSQLLIGPDATRANILKAIKFAAGGAEEHDVLIVYFAGHGQTVLPVGAAPHEKAGFLIAYDTNFDFTQPVTDLNVLNEQAISMSDVVRMICDSKAEHVLLILDCCFSGFAADVDVNTRALAPGEQQALSELLSEPTRQVFTAGTDKQKSLEVKQLEHGLFTYHLVNELKTSDKDIYSLFEAFAAVRGKVSVDAAGKGSGSMTPQLRQLKPSNGDWVFIDKAVADEALTRYEAKPRPKTTKDEYDTFTASARSAGAESEDAPLEEDPQYVAQVDEYEQRADAGDPYALAIMQYSKEHGVGRKKDEAAAFDYAVQANDFDNPANLIGKALLAHSYQEGVGVEKNPELAKNLNDAVSKVGGKLIQNSLTGGSTNLSNEDKVNLGVAAFNEVAGWFGTSGKVGDIAKLRRELGDAADAGKADKVNDKLTGLEKAMAALLDASHNADGKLSAEMAAKLGELHGQLAPHVKKARQLESVGALNRIEPELQQMDPAIATLSQLLPK